MTTPTLPVAGQTPWGDLLNAGILQVNTTASNAVTSENNHAANIPSDPHGDRAYAQSLVTPITTGVNGPNGYLKLNSSGQIPLSLISGSGGAFTSIYDVVSQYGAVPNTGSDQSAHIQSALDAAGSAGGGIVWIPAGTFSLANYLVISNNTCLLMSEGTTLKRITGSPTPSYLITNVKFGTNNTPSSNIEIVGGNLDAVGSGLTSNCTIIFIIQSAKTLINNVVFNNVNNNPAIEVNGCTHTRITSCRFKGTDSGSVQASVPAIRVNESAASTTPAGLGAGIYNDSQCNEIFVSNTEVAPKTLTYGPYGCLIGTDLQSAPLHNNILVTNSIMPYQNISTISCVFSNISWQHWSVSGCLFSDLISFTDGWIAITPGNGWTNSGSGPNFQWRYVNLGTPGMQQFAVFPEVTTVEVIGDMTTGTVTNGTRVGTLGIAGVFPPFVNPQIIPVVFPSFSSPSPNVRLYFDSSTNQIQCFGMSGAGGQRVAFHSFLSMTA